MFKFKIDINDKRSKNHIFNILLSFIFKSGAILFSVFLIPLFLRYLDYSTYGIWLTMYSTVGWLSLLDGGLGNGLKNKLSIALANNNINDAKNYVSTTYIGLSVIMVLICLLFVISLCYIDYSQVFNVPGNLSNQVNISFAIVFILFSIKFVFDLLISILLAKHKAAIVNLISFISNGLIFFILYLVLPHLYNDKLIYVSFILSIVPIIVISIFSFYLLNFKFKDIRPSFSNYRKDYLYGLLNLGFKFFVIQIAVIIVFSTDSIIINKLLGPASVTTYNVAFKLFSLFTLGWNIVLMPYWAGYTEAFEKKDFEWIRKSVSFLEKIWLLLLLMVVITLYFVNEIYFLWVGKSIMIPYKLSIVIALFVLISTLTNIYVYVINGIGKLKLQFLVSLFVGVLNIPLSIYMVRTFEMDSSGVMFATCICLSIGLVISYIQYKKVINHSDYGIWSK